MRGFIALVPVVFLLSVGLLIQSKAISKPQSKIVLQAATSVRPSITPTMIPSPTSLPTLTPTLSPSPSVEPSVEIHSGLIDQINSIREARSLPLLEPKSEVCAFADLRAQEIAQNFSHDGFESRRDHGGLPYPSFTQVVENIAMTGNPVGVWMTSQTHEANLMSALPYGCVGQNGLFSVFEGWMP
ncbi:MAG: CAP domain-containing protein [Weeksellaceae bacterium]